MIQLCRAPRALAALHRRSTFYEAGLFDPSGRMVANLVFDAKRTRRALLSAIAAHGPRIAEIAGVDAGDCAVEWQRDRFTIGESGFTVRWSGFTEFDRASAMAPRAAA